MGWALLLFKISHWKIKGYSAIGNAIRDFLKNPYFQKNKNKPIFCLQIHNRECCG